MRTCPPCVASEAGRGHEVPAGQLRAVISSTARAIAGSDAVAALCRQFVDIQDFCHNKLGVSDSRMAYMPWPEVLYRLVHLQKSVKLSLRGELSEHDIVMRIMRRDDYLIGAHQ
jgi:hypothetical protein